MSFMEVLEACMIAYEPLGVRCWFTRRSTKAEGKGKKTGPKKNLKMKHC
jgi:hypothetical protein